MVDLTQLHKAALRDLSDARVECAIARRTYFYHRDRSDDAAEIAISRRKFVQARQEELLAGLAVYDMERAMQ